MINRFKYGVCTLLLAFSSFSLSATPSQWLQSLEALAPSERQESVNSWWAQQSSLPLYDQGLLYFFARSQQAIRVNGDISFWQRWLTMTPVAGSDLHYLAVEVPSDSVVKYRLSSHGQEFLDPKNPLHDGGVFGADSLWYGPDHSGTGFDQPLSGRLERTFLDNNTRFSPSMKREVVVYVPETLPSQNLPVIYLQDGLAYLEQSHIALRLDALIEQGVIPPVIAVFIEPLQRDNEYLHYASDYYSWLSNTLLPWVEAQYPVSQSAEERVLVGASNAGDFVTFAGTQSPLLFGMIFNQSGGPHYSGMNDFGFKYLNLLKPPIVLSVVGLFERDYNVNQAIRFHQDLAANDNTTRQLLRFVPQGHTWQMWGDSFEWGIEWLLTQQGAQGLNEDEALAFRRSRRDLM